MTSPFQLTGVWSRTARRRELRRLWHIPPRTNPTLIQTALSRQPFTNQSSRRQNDQQRQKRPMPPAAAPDQSTPVPSTIGSLDVLGDVPVPTTAIDFCYYDGFMLDSGKKVTDGDGVLLYGGEAFRWRPWVARDGAPSLRLLDERGFWDGPKEAFGVFEGMWPRPGMFPFLSSPFFFPPPLFWRESLGFLSCSNWLKTKKK